MASPGASATFETTTAGSAATRPSRIAETSAAMFEPRPEIRIATRLPASGIDHVAVAADDLTDARVGLAQCIEVAGERLHILRRDDTDHADAHVERAVHLRFGDAAQLLHDGEHRQDGPGAPLDPGRCAFGKDAREVVGQPAPGDVGETADEPALDRGSE